MLCGAVVLHVVVYNFVLLLEEFYVVSWSDTGKVAAFEDGNVIVCSGDDFGSPVEE